ncbi:MAG: ATP-dependent DNA helicase RecG [Candidatus Moranbacteria bacterium]|nr:ATP-dependent DNA helicase RecG [Candidatus Moranbacteria bacterium]
MTTKPQLTSSINKLKGIGFKTQNLLYNLGIETLEDLIYYFPFRWDDFSLKTPISKLKPDEKVTVKAKLIAINNSRSFYRKLAITEAIVKDETGNLKIIWYNQPFLINSLKVGQKYLFNGKTKISKGSLFLQSPSFESLNQKKIDNQTDLIPIYNVTKGITPKMLRYYIKQALPLTKKLCEFLPEEIIQNQRLVSIQKALKDIHFPKNKYDLIHAKRRLSFNELFLLQLNYQIKKAKWQKLKAKKIQKKIPFVKNFLQKLPFTLTNDQKIALWKIVQDLDSETPMNRLLEGDVGSGKTIVSAVACFSAAKSKKQAALMAPTEILAKQHFDEFLTYNKYLKLPLALLTNSLTYISTNSQKNKIKKEALIEKIKKGKIKIIIGTHSIIQKKVQFKNISLIVVDEQHRFGVEQRAHLIKNSKSKTTPHFLSMSATPIPRTLALTIYGDLDISLIKEMPKGRKKIITKIVPPQKRNQAYTFIKEQILKGRQAFVICPLIEESEVLQTKSAQEEYQKLSQEIFPNLKIGLLHGRLKNQEKEQIMKKFVKNKISILVSTSVVEVGVNVPNATIMMIEGAERFGLSQLHQFRGRVGRGDHQSFCLLFTESPAPKTWQRLKYLEESKNGFELAQKDLKLRGPGDFLGDRQSGFSNLTIASLKDLDLIRISREEAKKLIKADPGLDNHPKLKKKIEIFKKEVHFE